MGRFSINNALAGAGSAIADIGGDYLKTSFAKNAAIDLERIRADIQGERDARLNEYSTQSQTRAFEHADRSQERAFGHAETMQDRGFEHSERLQDRGFTHAELMQTTSLEHAARENALNRQVTREGQSIAAGHLAIAAQGAALDREIKMIQVKNAKEVDSLKEQYTKETDPQKKAQISENISMLTGKDSDKFLPVPLKDEQGNITGYQIFDTKNGRFADAKKPVAEPSQGDIDGLIKRKDNPLAISYFEQKFGVGSAQRYLKPGEAKPAPKPTDPARDNYTGMQAQLDFDEDAKRMTPQALIAKYEPLESSLSMQQFSRLNEARNKIPKRVPIISSVFARGG